MSALENFEALELRAAEDTIEQGLKSFIKVGEALADIRNGRLYRAEHATFEDYCRERWNLDRSYAYETIKASETVRSLSGIPDTPAPANLGQARALSGLEPEQAAQAMRAAHEATDGNVTAAAIKAARPDAPAPMTEGEAGFGAGQSPASPALPQGEAGTYSSAGAVGATALGPLAPAAGFDAEPATTAPRPQVSDAFERHVMGDPGVMAAKYRASLASAMANAARLPSAFRPEDVAEVADADFLDSIERLVKNVTSWRDDIKRKASGLRVINGGMR